MHRRDFLKLGAAGLATGVYAAVRWIDLNPGDAEVAHFQSRPDLTPPRVKVEASASALAPGYVFLAPNVGPGQLGPLIIDNAGSPVWFHPRTDVKTSGLRVQEYFGSPVLTWWEGQSTEETGQGSFVIADTSYAEVGRVACGNGYETDFRDLVITAQGTAVLCAHATVPGEAGVLQGGARPLESIVQEIDIETGRVLFEWHSHDHVAVEESYRDRPGDSRRPFDYFHTSSIDVDDDGNLLVSGRNTHAVYKIDRRSGEVIWRLGGRRNNFTVAGDARFAWQHDVRSGGDGTLTLLDNEASPKEAEESRAIVIRLDTALMTATLDRQYPHPGGQLAESQGSMQLLEGGNVFVGWGSLPHFSEFDPGGALLFDGRFTGGGRSSRAYRFPWAGEPLEPPAAAIVVGRDKATVYASWNGATDVAEWQVLTGSSPDTLELTVASPRTGFETAMGLEAVPDYIAVSAVSASGAVLGTSQRIKV